MCRQKFRNEVPEAGKPALSCRLNRALSHWLFGHELLLRWNIKSRERQQIICQDGRAPVKNGRQPSYTNSLRRSTIRDQICICLRWTTTPGGPCSSCSAPRDVRAHMSMSGSRGNTGIPARSQPPKRCRRRQDIVLSASASIHQTSLRRAAEPKPIFCHEPVCETALARAFNTRRRAPSSYLLLCYFHVHRTPQDGTRCRPATYDAWSPRACAPLRRPRVCGRASPRSAPMLWRGTVAWNVPAWCSPLRRVRCAPRHPHLEMWPSISMESPVLDASRRQAKMRTHGLRFDEPARVVDCRFHRQCGDRTAPGNRTEAPTQFLPILWPTLHFPSRLVRLLHDFNVNFSDLPEYPDKQTFSVYVGRSQGCQSPEVGAYFVCVMPWITNYWTRGSLIRNDAPP